MTSYSRVTITSYIHVTISQWVTTSETVTRTLECRFRDGGYGESRAVSMPTAEAIMTAVAEPRGEKVVGREGCTTSDIGVCGEDCDSAYRGHGSANGEDAAEMESDQESGQVDDAESDGEKTERSADIDAFHQNHVVFAGILEAFLLGFGNEAESVLESGNHEGGDAGR